MNLLKRLWSVSISIFLCLFLSYPALANGYALTDILLPYGNTMEEVPEAWKVYYTLNATGNTGCTWYAQHFLNNEYVYCAQITQFAVFNASDYSKQDANNYLGSQKAYQASMIAAVGYGMDKSQEMDWATQVRIWQEIEGNASNWRVSNPIQAKINIINARLAILNQDVSFQNQDITLTGYGIENGIVLTDENGVFENYVENTNSGIHATRSGNSLTIWAEPQDNKDATLSYSCFYTGGSDAPSIMYTSPTSQNVFKANYPVTKTVSLNVHVQTGSVSISKTDITGSTELAGASLKVVDDNNNVIDEWISTDESHLIQGLTLNQSYTLIEDLAPLGYVKSNAIPFTITNPDTIETIQMVDEVVNVLKIDQTSALVKGATLQVLDMDGSVIDEWITGQQIVSIPEEMNEWDADGNHYSLTPDNDGFILSINNSAYYNIDKNGYETSHRVSNLVTGQSYILHEVSAEENYLLSEDIPFTVEGDTNLTMTDIKTDSVSISKVDATSNKEIEGAKLKLEDEEGNLIEEWTSTKKEHIIDGLIVGKSYTLTETMAPNGYLVAESITFTIEDNGEVLQKVTMKDKQKPAIPTGVSSPIFKYLGCIMASSLIGIVFIVKHRKGV